jgi:hypothetical protein
VPDSHVMTCKTFAGYLQCPTKGQLLWRSGTVEPDFIEMVSDRSKLASVAQIQTCIGRHLISYDELSAKCEQSCLIDCGTTYLDIRTTHIPQGVGAKTKSDSEGSAQATATHHLAIATALDKLADAVCATIKHGDNAKVDSAVKLAKTLIEAGPKLLSKKLKLVASPTKLTFEAGSRGTAKT